ncbi:hypothetical protein CPHO_08365 [Corynebacterium phocae]|uniref:Terminase n=1 Tax=Corynebacterium phocae TaxID=161895 RepID=A0A1L7D446_9CORY|nr:terminase family protein [Corynebacterium phocae]APT92898.1 hypothetical protein CPHO_08365 [Corynebacterium phocae]KAA8723220.1 PBSX family phage terminase large subunit [Corynebacterium phocae]
MNLSRRQAVAIKRSRHWVNLWYGSVRSGKTHASLFVLDRFMWERSQQPVQSGTVLIVGLSTNTVWRNIFQPLLTHQDYQHAAPHIRYRQNAPSGTMYGVPFSVVGANDERSWLSIQGMTVAFCLGDEVTSWPESFWNMLLTRLSLPDSWFLGTCNPGTANHYLKKVIDGGDPDFHTEVMLLEENPTLSRKYIDRLKRTYTGLFYRRMILAEWVAAEGAVFQGWDEKFMVAPSPSNATVLAVGVDYGTTHPSAGYALGVDPQGGLYIVAEWSPNTTPGASTTQALTDAQLGDSLEEWLAALPNPPRFLYVDPAAKSLRQELHTRGLINHRADNAVVPGIRTVDSLLTGGQLKIDPSCKQLINELPEYRWDAKATERGQDKPVKEKDDHVDALRYTVFSSRHLWRRLVRDPLNLTA